MNINTKRGNIFLHLQPLQRVLLSFFVALLTYGWLRTLHLSNQLLVSLLWDAFAFTFILTSWIVFFKLPVKDIIKRANTEDGSRAFVFFSVLITSVASLFTILLLLISKKMPGHETLTVITAVVGMILSWVLVHTIFTFHYAHLFYFKQKDDTPSGEGLDFPGDAQPDYLDFVYFAFVIGMTFQVSDVSIHSRIIRRTALAHALVSFALNTFVVALTINLVAGLKNG